MLGTTKVDVEGFGVIIFGLVLFRAVGSSDSRERFPCEQAILLEVVVDIGKLSSLMVSDFPRLMEVDSFVLITATHEGGT